MLWVRARIRVKVRVNFFRLYFKSSLRMEHSSSLFLFVIVSRQLIKKNNRDLKIMPHRIYMK